MCEKERIKHDKNKSWQVWTLPTIKVVYYEIQDGRCVRDEGHVLNARRHRSGFTSGRVRKRGAQIGVLNGEM